MMGIVGSLKPDHRALIDVVEDCVDSSGPVRPSSTVPASSGRPCRPVTENEVQWPTSAPRTSRTRIVHVPDGFSPQNALVLNVQWSRLTQSGSGRSPPSPPAERINRQMVPEGE